MNLPALPESFYWTHESWGPALRCRPLAAIAPHLFTTRHLELRATVDRLQDAPDAGWPALADAVQADGSAIVRLRQVHGQDVIVVRRGMPRPSFANPPEADAILSDDEECAVVVQAADCVPILMANPTTGVVAAVHAGWRGTAAGVTRAAVEALAREFGVKAADLVVAIGPSIGPCCYRVGDELIDGFSAVGHDATDLARWFVRAPELRLDLWLANHDQLVAAGVQDQRVHVCGVCTACHVDLLCSYRAEGARSGRLAAAIRAGSVSEPEANSRNL